MGARGCMDKYRESERESKQNENNQRDRINDEGKIYKAEYETNSR